MQIALDLEMINERTTRVVMLIILKRDYAQFGQRLCDLIRGAVGVSGLGGSGAL